MEQSSSTITGRVLDGRTGVIEVQGDMNAASEKALMAAYACACGAGTKGIVLNFDRLEFLNSGGIGLLVTLLVRAQRAGTRLLATGLSDHYRQILSLTRLDEAIEIHVDEAAALAAAGA